MQIDEDAKQIWRYPSKKFNVCVAVSWCLCKSPIQTPTVDSFYLEMMRFIQFGRYAGDEQDG